MRKKIFDQNNNDPGASCVRCGRVLHHGPGRHGEGGLCVGSAGQVIYNDNLYDMSFHSVPSVRHTKCISMVWLGKARNSYLFTLVLLTLIYFRKYSSLDIVRFTTADEGMGDCVGAGLGAPTGGSVMWTGSGMFAAR